MDADEELCFSVSASILATYYVVNVNLRAIPDSVAALSCCVFCALSRSFTAIKERSPLSLKIGAGPANLIQVNSSQFKSIQVKRPAQKKTPIAFALQQGDLCGRPSQPNP
jgi:hypothetical protein